jgi:DNA-binding IclR family transcriptional regulator
MASAIDFPIKHHCIELDSYYRFRMNSESGLAVTLARAACVLEAAVRGDGLLFQEAVAATGTVPSTVSRMLQALTASELLQHGDDGRYRLAPRMRRLALAVVGAPDLAMESMAAARALMMATGESAAVFVPVDEGVQLIAKSEPLERFQYMGVGGVNQRCDRHGFCLLRAAWWDSKTAKRRLSAASSSVAADKWLRRIQKARTAGVMVNGDDDQPGITRIVAPVVDQNQDLVAVIGVSVTSVVAETRHDHLVREVRTAAHALAGLIGHSS